jgi:ABC-type multidrug transport system fused ATPase/permease subunit
MSTRK